MSNTTTTRLVLLPGLDGTGILLEPLLRHLPIWIRPMVIEYPQSGTQSYEEILEFVVGEVASLEKFAVLGWSFGGPLALRLAGRFPERASAVILCASFVTPPCPEMVPYRALVTTPVFAIVRALRRLRYVIPGLASSDLRRAKAAIWGRVGARVLSARARAVMAVDARSALRECRAPIMYLASNDDRVVRQPSLEEVMKIAPHTRLAMMDGCHLALFTQPAAAADHIAEFLG